MKIIKALDYDHMSRIGANIIAAQITLKPESVLGLATGSTPVGTYQNLIQKYEAGDLDFSAVTSINLDEYRGISGENKQSYRYFMNKHLFKHVNIRQEATFVPDGLDAQSDRACREYDRIISESGGVDLQILGLGHNGHIGFNEPASSFEKQTHCVDLAQSTIDANARFFSSLEEVPKQAYTMGIQTIMQARKIMVLVSGKDKAQIVKTAFFGPITPMVPASVLQLHPDVVLIADEDALSAL